MAIIDSVVTEGKELWQGGKGPSLVTIASGWGLLLGTRMIYPVLLPYFRNSFDLSLTIAGLLITILWLGSAVGQLPGGILADRYSERIVMAGSAVIVGFALILVVTAPSASILFAATGIVGLGQSLYPIARITFLSHMYPDRIGSALGVTMATGDLGQTILPPIAGVLAVMVTWQAGLSFLIPLLLVVGIGIVVALPVQEQADDGEDTLSAERARLIFSELRESNLGFVTIILILFFLIWQSFTGLYPTYLVEVKGLSSSTAGLLFSTFFAFGVVVKPLAGAAYDRIGMRSALVIVLAGPVVGLGLLPFIEGVWALVGITAIVSTMLGSGAITQSFLANAFSAEIRGTGLGIVRTITAIIGATGPVLFGAIADRGYFDEGYLLLAAVLAVVILLTLRLPKSASG
ncbi:MFS transporter [Natrinema caseinilyticum]|uniref:MFS transporter n=1 Tax=Natrinema caseinilyticum TaxID=2961570 RepID=UPI0020C37CE6|nr:MFS transporter [Natrinema caseinilyticum]